MTDKLNIRKSVNWGGRVKRLNWLVVMALVLSLVMPAGGHLPCWRRWAMTDAKADRLICCSWPANILMMCSR